MAEEGWTQGNCQATPGFPSLLINALESLGVTERPRYFHFHRKSTPMTGGPFGWRSGPDNHVLRTTTSSTGRHPQCAMPFPVRHNRYRAGNGRRMIAVSISKDCGSRHDGLLRKSGLDYIRPPRFSPFIPYLIFVSDPLFP